MNQFQNKPELPNATAVLIMGILALTFSLLSCVFLPVFLIAVILGIITLAISASSVRLNRQSPGYYSGYGNIQAGRICSIIALCIGGVYLLLVLFYLIFLGSMFSVAGFM